MIICYDTEIQKAIPPKDGRLELGVNYCDGWHDFAGMGIAVLCCQDEQGGARVFGEGNLHKAQEYFNYADLHVSFNGIGFDNKLLAANGIILPLAKQLDLMQVLYTATGKRYKLGDICRRNFNVGKAEDGAMAPILWQEGEKIRVIDYCLADVNLTMKLYRKMRDFGQVTCPYTGGTIKTDLTRLMEAA